MQWVIDNWILLVLGGAMLAMHLFGHGGHGGHSGRDKPRHPDQDGAADKEPQDNPASKISATVIPTMIPKAGPKPGKPLKIAPSAPSAPKAKENPDGQ